MILELINKLIRREADRIIIHYQNHEEIEKSLSELSEEEKGKLKTLVIWGDHGNNKFICKLNKKDVTELVGRLPRAQFDTIVLDACESAVFANDFIPLLSENGIILCHMGICGAQIMSDEVDETNVRTKWKETINNISWKELRGSITAQFPAIYSNSSKSMTYLHLEDMGFETETEKEPFTSKCLKHNVDETGAEKVSDITSFLSMID